jgi:hypothetical protein
MGQVLLDVLPFSVSIFLLRIQFFLTSTRDTHYLVGAGRGVEDKLTPHAVVKIRVNS